MEEPRKPRQRRKLTWYEKIAVAVLIVLCVCSLMTDNAMIRKITAAYNLIWLAYGIVVYARWESSKKEQ